MAQSTNYFAQQTCIFHSKLPLFSRDVGTTSAKTYVCISVLLFLCLVWFDSGNMRAYVQYSRFPLPVCLRSPKERKLLTFFVWCSKWGALCLRKNHGQSSGKRVKRNVFCLLDALWTILVWNCAECSGAFTFCACTCFHPTAVESAGKRASYTTTPNQLWCLCFWKHCLAFEQLITPAKSCNCCRICTFPNNEHYHFCVNGKNAESWFRFMILFVQYIQHPVTIAMMAQFLGPIHTGHKHKCRQMAPVVNGSVHIGCQQHQRNWPQICMLTSSVQWALVSLFSFGVCRSHWKTAAFCFLFEAWISSSSAVMEHSKSPRLEAFVELWFPFLFH